MRFLLQVQSAFLLTLFAGLSTALGGMTIFFMKEPKLSYLSPLLGFAAGVMIYVSMVELLVGSIEEIGFISANFSFFIGIIFMFFLDRLIPHIHIDTEADPFFKDTGSFDEEAGAKLRKAGLLTAIGIALHNFPEGMAVFSVSMLDTSLGLSIAIAIAVHNIPEGIAVSVPIFYSTGSKMKGFGYSLLSGVAEPMGAAIGFLFLSPFLTHTVLNASLAFVGGIMVFISFDELIPISKEYGDEHMANIGLFLGMVVMAVTLIFI